MEITTEPYNGFASCARCYDSATVLVIENGVAQQTLCAMHEMDRRRKAFDELRRFEDEIGMKLNP